MIELRNDALTFSFPEVHPSAKLTIDFQRTLRIPDDDQDHPLPPGLGRFPLEHLDDHLVRAPKAWWPRGGVVLPMYQSEALWLSFDTRHVRDRGEYPFAIKVAAGKVNAVTGDSWSPALNRHPQDYLVSPTQPWIDGYCVEQGIVRQFVAMPLGSGYSAEEQITGEAEFGGIQIIAYPMKRDVFERRFPKRHDRRSDGIDMMCSEMCVSEPAMGLAAGGRMRQEIYDDPFDINDWDLTASSRCFVHLCNSQAWEQITDKRPPTPPPSAFEYMQAGLPWFDYYDDQHTVRPGGKILQGVKSVAQIATENKEAPPPDNTSARPYSIVDLKAQRSRLKKGQVRESPL